MQASLIVALLFSAFIYSAAFLNLPKKVDLARRLAGWKELGQGASKIVAQMEKDEGQKPFIFSSSYRTTAELAFYVHNQPEVYNVSWGHRRNQYNLWQDFGKLAGMNAIYVETRGENIEPAVSSAFARWERVPPLYFYRKGEIVKTFSIFKCYGFKGRF